MEKSPEAFRTIREVADALDLPQHVLRFWETRFPQVRPLKRAGGRRYYRPDDVERLWVIKRLLYEEGYTIKGVQKLFRDQGVRALTSGVALPRPDPAQFPPLDLTPEGAEAGEPFDPALEAGGEEDEAGPAQPSAAGLPQRPAYDALELERLREALASLRQAERLLLQARTGER